MAKKSFTVFLLSVRDLQFYWSMSTHSFFELRMKKAVDAVRFHKCRLPDSPQQAGPFKAKWRETPFVSIQNEALWQIGRIYWKQFYREFWKHVSRKLQLKIDWNRVRQKREIPLQKEKKGKTRRARGKERVSSRLVETLASKFESGTSTFLSNPSPRQFLDNDTNKATKKTIENANES